MRASSSPHRFLTKGMTTNIFIEPELYLRVANSMPKGIGNKESIDLNNEYRNISKMIK